MYQQLLGIPTVSLLDFSGCVLPCPAAGGCRLHPQLLAHYSPLGSFFHLVDSLGGSIVLINGLVLVFLLAVDRLGRHEIVGIGIGSNRHRCDWLVVAWLLWLLSHMTTLDLVCVVP